MHLENLKGVVERIIYLNEENAYCIAELSPLKSKNKVPIFGVLPGVQCGETLLLKGEWTEHPKHGQQFKVHTFKSELPATVYGIKKYLGSGLISGIGKSYANKIVEYFGAQTIDIINSESARLTEIPGIGKARAQSIKKAWEEQVAVRDTMLFLQTYGVSPSQCLKLVKKYGLNTKRIIQDQPYKIAEDIERIGFKTADQIALNLGYPTNSNERIEAGIIHTVTKIQEEGHTLALIPHLTEQCALLLGLKPQLIQTRIEHLDKTQKLYSLQAYDKNNGHLGLAVQKPIYTFLEKNIAQAVFQNASAPSNLPNIKLDSALLWAEKKAGFEFGALQKSAVCTALSNKLSIITGGPGTGKTTILKALVDILIAKKSPVLLTSPTGRAAQRLSDATDQPASTIHRLLKYDPSTRSFFHHKENPLKCNCIIIDEASMIDSQLASSLLDAIPPTAHIVLVGDSDQLPSVGPGNILSDLIHCSFSKVVRLDTIFRQAKESKIITTAHEILKGVSEPYSTIKSLHQLDNEADFNFIEAEDPEKIVQAIVYLTKDYLPKKENLDSIKDIQVLSPMHKGNAGIKALNEALQENLNSQEQSKKRLKEKLNYSSSKQAFFREKTQRPLPFEITYGNANFRLGDKVIQTVNNYDKNIFNGDLGIIEAIGADSTTISVQFNDQRIEYKKNELSELQLAYTLSIHKSQGSEYPAVIVPLLKQHFIMLQRNLLYTAITRAKKKLFLIGSIEAYSMSVRNNKTEIRRTNQLQQFKKCEKKLNK